MLTCPWGSETRIRSCGGAVVLVDEPAEQVPPANISRVDRDRVRGLSQRWGQGEGAMRAPAVVVLGVGPERPIEMPPTEDERPVEALDPDGLDHPFRVGIGIRGPDRRSDHAYPLGAEHRVERDAELRVPVSDEEPDGRRVAIEVHGEVPGLLGDPRRVGMRWIRRLPSSMNTRTYSVRS